MSSNPFSIVGGIGSPIAPMDMKLDTSLDSTTKSSEAGGSFAGLLAKALNASNDAQWDAGTMNEKLVTGKLQNTHELTIAGAKAEVMLHLTTQIASKLSQATTQLFQMQI